MTKHKKNARASSDGSPIPDKVRKGNVIISEERAKRWDSQESGMVLIRAGDIESLRRVLKERQETIGAQQRILDSL
ncbi:hypothetical protein [Sodalis sp. dw_96]|uniref:hypothetical protein n=1 Tax=Sodalis sp. dw_96 TaxID=2719794 RepID=UPI001BD36E8A|nr:hypothetical protein [Sodalis sp. dw_96]